MGLERFRSFEFLPPSCHLVQLAPFVIELHPTPKAAPAEHHTGTRIRTGETNSSSVRIVKSKRVITTAVSPEAATWAITWPIGVH
jgi:hypothetical protein